MRTLLKIMTIVIDVAAKVLLCMAVLPIMTGLFGIQTYCVQSGSMEPVLKTGSIIFTKKPDTIVPGDIVTFQKCDMTVTHRVLCEENGIYITKGDANKRKDAGIVLKSQMKGKVMKLPGDRYCVPYAGYLQAAAIEWKWGILTLLVAHEAIKQKKEVAIYDK